MTERRAFRFLPRYKRLAWASLGVGGPVALLGAIGGVVVPIVFGAFGVVAGTLYLRSKIWKLEVLVGDDALEVRGPDRTRFTLPWGDVKRVIASPTTHTCFVDGGAPERSLLVPGIGAPAPYDVADKPALYAAILAHVAADKVETVERLELHNQPPPAKATT